MNADAAAALTYVVTGASFAVLPQIPRFIMEETPARTGGLMVLYNTLPHFEVFDMRQRISFNYGPVPADVLSLSAVYAASLVVIVLTIAWFSYRNKRFLRSSLSQL